MSADEIIYTTKIGLDSKMKNYNPQYRTAGMREEVVEELRRQAAYLGVKSFATVAIHHTELYDESTMVDTYAHLAELIKEGLVKGLQLSSTGWDLGTLLPSSGSPGARKLHGGLKDPDAIEKAVKAMAMVGLDPIAIQATVSLFNDAFAWYGVDNAKYANLTNMTIMAIEFLSRPESRRRQFLTQALQQELMRMTRTKTFSALLLQWAVHRGMVPIIGSLNADHIRENYEAATKPIRNDAQEILTALRWLAQPCRQMHLSDVFSIDSDLLMANGKWDELMYRYPTVCYTGPGT